MFYIILSLIIVVFSSCGTIIHGKDQVVQVVSEPQGAAVNLNGKQVGQTPVAVTLPRKQDHQITVSKSGYHGEEAQVKRKLSPIVLLYLLPGGAVSFGADALSGAQFSFPDSVKVTLQPLFTPKAVASDQLRVLKTIAKKLYLRKAPLRDFNQL